MSAPLPALARIASGLAEIAAGLAALAADTQGAAAPGVTTTIPLAPPAEPMPLPVATEASLADTTSPGATVTHTRKPRAPKPEAAEAKPVEPAKASEPSPVVPVTVSAAELRDTCRKASGAFGVARVNECLGGVNVVDMTEDQRVAAKKKIDDLLASVVQ